jgi:oligopeptide/dipeptide ABC transporter ATP-binding protein
MGVSDGQHVLKIKNLSVGFWVGDALLPAVTDINLELHHGETIGIVGESGSGKSVAALAVLNLLPKPTAEIISGEVVFEGRNILDLTTSEISKIRGAKIAFIFQEPMSALNPVVKVGRQVAEILEIHAPSMSGEEIKRRVMGLFVEVGISAPEQRVEQFPHQLSGGMRQRVMIAMALAAEPDILIADEPTTALDVTIQSQILKLIKEIQKKRGMAMILITHDFGIVQGFTDRTFVMYGGRIIEAADTKKIISSPCHPYSQGLIASMPSFSKERKSILRTIEGVVPALGQFPLGCSFQDRCSFAQKNCTAALPQIEVVSLGHEVRCVRWKELSA